MRASSPRLPSDRRCTEARALSRRMPSTASGAGIQPVPMTRLSSGPRRSRPGGEPELRQDAVQDHAVQVASIRVQPSFTGAHPRQSRAGSRRAGAGEAAPSTCGGRAPSRARCYAMPVERTVPKTSTGGPRRAFRRLARGSGWQSAWTQCRLLAAGNQMPPPCGSTHARLLAREARDDPEAQRPGRGGPFALSLAVLAPRPGGRLCLTAGRYTTYELQSRTSRFRPARRGAGWNSTASTSARCARCSLADPRTVRVLLVGAQGRAGQPATVATITGAAGHARLHGLRVREPWKTGRAPAGRSPPARDGAHHRDRHARLRSR
jgi:hypothetical protein